MSTQWHALIVEDDADGAEVVARILDFHKLTYDVANNAEDALKLIDSAKPDICIVDLNLPGMDGLALLRNMRNNPATSHIPAVAVTAYHSMSVHEEAIQAGFEAYFPKPVDKMEFIRELDQILMEQ